LPEVNLSVVIAAQYKKVPKIMSILLKPYRTATPDIYISAVFLVLV